MTKTNELDDIDALVNSIEGVSVESKSKKKKNTKKPVQESVEGCSTVEEAANGDALPSGDPDQTKKSKKKKKKANDTAPGGETNPAAVDMPKAQTNPPTVPVSHLFPDGQFPIGQIMDHPVGQSDTTAKNRFNSEEARAVDRLQIDLYNEVRQAAEAHRQTRQHIQSWVKPGMKMIDICEELEKTARIMINQNGLEAGLAFPAHRYPRKRSHIKRIALEAYPGFTARKIIRGSYKSDSPAKQTHERKDRRKLILDAISTGEAGLSICLEANRRWRQRIIADARGDLLDAVICSLQAGHAALQRNFGLPRNLDTLEGWIASVPVR